MEVVGRHALLFDDDATCGFVNSREALVEWNSLLIDRYDVRHLLPSPISLSHKRPSSSQQQQQEEESQLDQIRYQDLPLQQSQSVSQEAAGYRAVPFSYQTPHVPAFLPPFPIPQSLLQCLPPTEKLHQIMARTAIFVSEHGGQSEIVLRVKQGNNPTFGFLMPHHHLHPYFRFLVDHPQFLNSDGNTIQKQTDVTGEALSLLGSIYGSGEDDDVAAQIILDFADNEPGNAFNATTGVRDLGAGSTVASGYSAGLDLAASRHPYPVHKEKASSSKTIHPVSALTSTTAFSKKKEGNVLGSLPNSSDKSRTTIPTTSMTEPLIVEPPSETKKTMDKIVEFVLKNGKEFEAVLIEQDRPNGRFPFLLPSNQYHPYYLKSIRKAQESKQAGKTFSAHKKDLAASGKKSKDTDTLSNGTDSHDLPFDTERKEKFKMVITGSKKDAQDPAPKPSPQQCGMSVDAAAAILQAATRGLRNPKLEIPLNTTFNDAVQGFDSEGGPASSFATRSVSSQIHSSPLKHVAKDEPSVSIPVDLSMEAGDVSVAKAIAKSAALAAATEADSSEACLTKEQKQKAERLKRAKMFAAIIKSGAVPQKTNKILTRLSAEPPDSMLSGIADSGCKAELKDGYLPRPDCSNHIIGREREGSVPHVADSDRMGRKMNLENDYNELKSKKRHHSSSRRLEEDDDEAREHKHSRKKRHSHHSSRHSKGEHRQRKRHSSSKSKESHHRHNHHSSSEDEKRCTSRFDKHGTSHSKGKAESEDDSSEKLFHEPSIVASGKNASRETSLDLVNDRWEGSAPSVEAQPSDELRAKVRAMLLATL